MKIHLAAVGDFPHVLRFIDQLAHMQAVLVLDFSYRMKDHRRWEFVGDILLLDKASFAAANIDLPVLANNMFNPFCIPEQRSKVFPLPIAEKLKTTALADMKMVGYLQQGAQWVAFIALPGLQLLDVHVGDRLGKEAGLVSAIKTDRVEIEVSGQPLFTMPLLV